MGFLSRSDGDEDLFDGYDEFVPRHLPSVGEHLDGHDVLAGRDHAAFHRLTRDLFEERTVYDTTFGYNLARLNLDRRHPDAGYRYAVERRSTRSDSTPRGESGDGPPDVLRAAFAPTTPFCPQSHTLTVASFRAWNGLSHRHEYDLVRVRVVDHHRSGRINERLRELEETYLQTGRVDGEPEDAPDGGAANASERDGSTTPF